MVYLAASEATPLLQRYLHHKQEFEVDSNIFGVRHVQAILLFLGICFAYSMRANISAAVVPMTQLTAGQPYFDWDPAIKSLILSSFFWGYVVAQLPASLLAKRFGGKVVLGYAIAVASILTILHPLAANYGGWQLLCVLRVFIGCGQGVVYPCIHTLLAKWVPRTERAFLATSVYSGAQFGTCVLLAISGSIFDSIIGWPGIFYLSGGISLVWAVLFLFFGADAPSKAKLISKEERDYIESLTGSEKENAEMAVPWKAIFTSLPFYGLMAAHCGFTWGFYTLLTEMPSYTNSVLHLDVKANALLSALPYFFMWLLCFVMSPVSDWLINHHYTSVSVSRKLFNTIGQWVPMVCLIALGYMTEKEKTSAIVLLTIAVGFQAASFCGYLVNHMDLSPNFAGLLMGKTNCISNLMSAIAPLVAGAVVHNEENPAEWRIVFFITGGVYLVCNSVFLILGKGNVQPWNYQPAPNESTGPPTDSAPMTVTSTPSDE